MEKGREGEGKGMLVLIHQTNPSGLRQGADTEYTQTQRRTGAACLWLLLVYGGGPSMAQQLPAVWAIPLVLPFFCSSVAGARLHGTGGGGRGVIPTDIE